MTARRTKPDTEATPAPAPEALTELRAQNHLLIEQVEALRRLLEERDAEIAQLSRMLADHVPD